jgi:hypothetical protein
VRRLFANEVLASLDVGRIARQDAAALLGIGEQNVGRFKSELLNSARG